MSKLSYLAILALTAALPCVCLANNADERAAEVKTGVEGVIRIGPARGGPIREGEESTIPLPAVAFAVMKGTEQAATFVTDAEGRFRLALPPGSYQAAPIGQPKIGHYGPFDFVVTEGKVTQVEWVCDSGMR
jgi:hypothetical protein